MKFKKIIASALAGALAFAMAVPAFAASDLAGKTDYEATMKAPTIKVTVPDTGAVTVNPYKMTVVIEGSDVTDQIISPASYIKNESDVALNVDVAVTGTVSTGVTFATATTQGTKAVTTKSIFMYFEIKAATDNNTPPSWASAYDSKAADQILVGAKEVKKAGMLTLGAGNTDATYAAYRLAGDAASAPTIPWTDADSIKVSVAFTFTPTAPASKT